MMNVTFHVLMFRITTSRTELHDLPGYTSEGWILNRIQKLAQLQSSWSVSDLEWKYIPATFLVPGIPAGGGLAESHGPGQPGQHV